MTNDLQKGKLKRWNDNKKFGFIATADRRKDIFIHISAFKRMGRRPTVGDIIIYQIHTDNDGKLRAVNAKIEGVENVKQRPVRRTVGKPKKSNWFSKALAASIVILLGSFVFNKLFTYNEIQKCPAASISTHPAKENYTCEGKVYCSEMTSCDEAKFYQRNCPGTKMDGDRDGIPCEGQWCKW